VTGSASEPRIEVLLVEDDERLAKLTSRYLEGTGFVVRWVTSGLQALADTAHHSYDVICST
jgi:DNA-binding response OmpR family regulator